MRMELKEVITKYIIENINDFQIVNNTINHFREYIYNSEGNYLIGGQEVANFIKNMIDILR